MTGPEAVRAIEALGISQAKFARLAGITPQAITKWVNGNEPSRPVVVLLRLLLERPELVRVLEVMK